MPLSTKSKQGNLRDPPWNSTDHMNHNTEPGVKCMVPDSNIIVCVRATCSATVWECQDFRKKLSENQFIT